VGGILIADYFVIRRTRLDLAGLYRADGPYRYLAGWNPIALVALAAGIAPCVPGFLGTVSKRIQVAPVWLELYHYAWFISFGIAFILYTALMMLKVSQRGSRVPT
jgi:NCS1 family nucleobase:cation symporter-1